MTDMTKNKISPRDEIAAIGFNAAIRLLSIHRHCSEQDAVEYLAFELGRAIPQIEHYRVVGLSIHLVPKVIEIMRQNKIPFGRHQLAPTKEIIAMAQWRNTK